MIYKHVPRELNGPSAIVTFARETRPLSVGGVTIITLRFEFFFEAQAPSKGSIRCGGPPPSGLVGDLTKKCCDFTLSCGDISCGAKFRE